LLLQRGANPDLGMFSTAVMRKDLTSITDGHRCSSEHSFGGSSVDSSWTGSRAATGEAAVSWVFWLFSTNSFWMKYWRSLELN
jgi:hypothetical protein